MQQPLVTVICLSYNHEKFIREAVNSVLAQTYKNLEIILIDDASADNTPEIIKEFKVKNPLIKTILLNKNIGNCRAFNVALKEASGKYIIDFATDDILLHDRIEKQITFFEQLASDYGVVFTDAIYINEDGHQLYQHFKRLFALGLLKNIPEGDIYRNVLSTYFIPGPTMMVKKEVFEKLGGYDETLSYEDFDFWVRSSRYFKYAYLPEVTTKIRLSKKSMSRGWYKQGDKQVRSTYEVCKKAFQLNENEDDKLALAERLKFEIRQCIFSQNNDEAKLFYRLLQELGYNNTIYKMLMILNKLKLPLAPLRAIYHKWRYGV